MPKKRNKPYRNTRPKQGLAAPSAAGTRTRRRWLAWSAFAVVVCIAATPFVSRWSPKPAEQGGPHIEGRTSKEPADAEAALTGRSDRLGQSTVNVASRDVVRGSAQDAIDQLAAKVDAQQDDWQTEVLSEAALAQLDTIKKLLERGSPVEAEDVALLVGESFTCGSLCPAELTEVYRDRRIVVRRPTSLDDRTDESLEGALGLCDALNQLQAELGDQSERHAKFKLYRIERKQDYFSTRIRYEGSVLGDTTGRQQTALWNCHWSYPAEEGAPPRLQRITLNSYEQCEISSPGGRLFEDCTESALAANACYREQVLPGIDHWLSRIPTEFIGRFGHNGLAVGDVNGDGLDDLYVCDSGGLPNRLYLQQPDGTAREKSAAAGVDFLDDSAGALLLDLDNDGDQDLVVAAAASLRIAANDGQGRFTLQESVEINADTLSITSADFDADGDLDLYLCGYNVRRREPTDRGLPFPWPYFDANNGERNVLLRNEGDLRFVDATTEVGLDENNSRFSMAASWEDFDNDGDQDLYVANDFGRNNLYLNDKGRFRDVAAEAEVEDHASGMSVSWGDYDRDGRMDLYVGNMFSAAGNRVTYQQRFSQGRADEAVAHLQRMARGNTLFSNVSEPEAPKFRDVSEQEAVEMGRWAWASSFADLTNDGWPDLVVANGYITNALADDL